MSFPISSEVLGMVADLREAMQKLLIAIVAAIDSASAGEEEIATLRQRYDRAVQRRGRSEIGRALSLQVGEVDLFSQALRRATGAALSDDHPSADDEIAMLRFLVIVERISQAIPNIIPRPELPVQADEVFARKQLRALELVLRALINEQYGKQDLLIERLEALFKPEIVAKWLKDADPGDVLSGTLLSEIAGIFTHKEEFPRYRPIYDRASVLTFLADKQKTIRTFLEDTRFLRNRVAHHKPLTAIQVDLLDHYYEQIVGPVQTLSDRGVTTINPDAILDTDATTLDNYFAKMKDDIHTIEERTAEIARDVTAIRGQVETIHGETKGIGKRTKLIFGSAFAAAVLAGIAVWQLGFVGRDTSTIRTQVGTVTKDVSETKQEVGTVSKEVSETKQEVKGTKREVSEDPRKELANMGIAWSPENYLGAIFNGDTRALELFLNGGMNPYVQVADKWPLPVQLASNRFNSKRGTQMYW